MFVDAGKQNCYKARCRIKFSSKMTHSKWPTCVRGLCRNDSTMSRLLKC